MKKRSLFLRTFLVIMGLAFIAGCEGGVFTDPGMEDASGGGGVTKPSRLASSASYSQAINKLDEIINYCNATSGNSGPRTAAVQARRSLADIGSAYRADIRSQVIPGINSLIDALR
jgi:hypothetical protein